MPNVLYKKKTLILQIKNNKKFKHVFYWVTKLDLQSQKHIYFEKFPRADLVLASIPVGGHLCYNK